MGKNNYKIIYIYCIVIIIFCVAFIAKTEVVSRYIFVAIRNELLPNANNNHEYIVEFIDELVPLLVMSEETPGVEKLHVEGEYSEYTWDLEAEKKTDNNGKQSKDNLDNTVSAEAATGTDAIDLVKEESDDVIEATVISSKVRGISYSMEQLSNYDFLLSNCYNVDSSTSVFPDEINADNLLGIDMSLDLTGDDYKVLIYHTHGSEAFADSRPGVTDDTVIGVGDELAEILSERYGIKVYHNRNVYDTIDGVVDRSHAYDLAGADVDAILANNPSIDVIIDLHRDGVREDLHLVRNINGKDTAQIMFVNGMSRLNRHGDIDYLYNPNKISNLAFSLKMHLAGKKKYGDLMRNIYISGYRYNLDKKPKSALIEVGAQTNTVSEAKNAMEPLADIIYSVLTEG